jgi:energy-converting hydrogenase A subunit R
MICFDLEGPLSPQDNAYEVMKLAKNGGTVFEALSKYDDILALKGRTGYEPGDTLKLIVPFLIYYGITEQDIKTVSERAVLVDGMKETVDWLRGEGIPVRIISTSYQQHAHSVGERLGVSKDDIASTLLDFKSMHSNA